MIKTLFRFLVQLFELNMCGLAVVGPLLFVLALADWGGFMHAGATMQMMGRTVESNSDYQAFLVSTAALSLIGWVYVALGISGKLHFAEPRKRNKIKEAQSGPGE